MHSRERLLGNETGPERCVHRVRAVCSRAVTNYGQPTE